MFDSSYVKFRRTIGIHTKLTQSALLYCFEKYRSNITDVNIYSNNQGLIFFSDYNYVDELLLLSSNSFKINNESLVVERMMQRKRFQSKQLALQM